MSEISTTEIYKHLRDEINSLKKELKLTLEAWYILSNETRPRLLAVYDSHFREYEVCIQEKSLELADLQRRVELLTIKATRGEKLTPEVVNAINTLVDKEFERLRQRVNDIVAKDKQTANKENADKSLDGEIPKMYRLLVKKLHPDYNEVNDFTKRMWQSTQEAYSRGDARTLQSLYNALVGTDEDASGVDIEENLESLEKLKSTLNEKLKYEKKKLDKLIQQEPFTLEKQLDDEIWINSHKLNLKKSIEKTEHDIELSQIRYRELTGKNYDANSDTSLKEHSNFTEKFSENTYFGQR